MFFQILYLIFDLLLMFSSIFLLHFRLSLLSLPLIFQWLLLFLLHLWSNPIFSFFILPNPILHIFLSLQSLRIIMVPIIIISFKKTKRKINVVKHVLNLSNYILVDDILLFNLLLELLSLLLFKVSHIYLTSIYTTDQPDYFWVEHFIYIVELLLIMVCQSPQLQISLRTWHNSMICYFLSRLC